VQEPREAEIAVRGASVRSGAATVLSHSDIHAHNSFKQTDMVHPQNETLEVKGRTLNYTLRPASVTRLTLSLA
jgi:alpha-N-arabinofuranosidase